MKILNTTDFVSEDFVSERMNINPITREELDKAKENMQKNPKMNDAYTFLSSYIDKKVLDAVDEIITLKTGNIRLVLTADKFKITENPFKCTIYPNDNCWRTIYQSAVSRRGPYPTFDEMMTAFKKWIEKKYIG